MRQPRDLPRFANLRHPPRRRFCPRLGPAEVVMFTLILSGLIVAISA